MAAGPCGGKEADDVRFRSAGWLTALVLAGLLAYGCITLMNIRSKVDEAAKTEAQLQMEAEQIQEENAALRHALDHQDDPDTIEDIAREKLGLVMPDERIFYDAGE